MAKQEQETALQILRGAIRQKCPARLYFFHGEESFLKQHYVEQLRKLLTDKVTESFNSHKLTGENFQVQTFADAVENLPMMAETTFLWVDDVDIFKLNETDREKMAEVLSDIPEYCTVVFTYETVAWKPDRRLKKLWDAVDRNAQIVEFSKQEQRDLVPWITRHFHAHQKQITPDLCVYLIEITGGTMTALASEIAKICAFSGAADIHKSDIDAVTEPVLDAVAFQMTDLLSRKEYGAALQKLQQLLKMQQEPLAVLGAIGGHFRRLGAARTLLDNGQPASELTRLYGLKDYAARKTMNAASRFSAQFYKRAAELVLETDYGMKTSLDEPQRLLEILILQLAREANDG